MLEQIYHVELSQRAYDILKDMIYKREFKGGEKLDLNYLSESMNISRTPLKDAVNRLTSEGLIEVKPRKGTYIVKIETKDISEMMEMRLMIEQWIISNLKSDEIHMLASSLKKLHQESQEILKKESFSYDKFVKLDLAFHNKIVAATSNNRMINMYKSLNSHLLIARVLYFEILRRSMKTLSEHELIIEALEKLDIKLANRFLEEHLLESKNQMILLLNKNGGYI